MMMTRIAAMIVVSAAVISCTTETANDPGTGPAWQTEFETAKMLATEGGAAKLILADFHTDWCGWCKKLDRDVFAQAAFQEKAGGAFVLLKVNPETSPSGRQLAEKHGVEGFPTVVFLDAGGNLVRKIVGYKPLEAFLREMDEALKSVS